MANGFCLSILLNGDVICKDLYMASCGQSHETVTGPVLSTFNTFQQENRAVRSIEFLENRDRSLCICKDFCTDGNYIAVNRKFFKYFQGRVFF